MNQKAQAMLKALLSASEYYEELLRFLPAPLAAEIQTLEPAHRFSPATLLNAGEWAQPIHYSWFAETIKEYPTAVKYLFLGALHKTQAKGIQQMLSLTDGEPQAPPFLRPFLLDILRKNLQEPELLSEPFLPPSPLNLLLNIERKYLFRVADLLGLHDLAADLRQVVDKALLNKVHAVLTEEERLFLNYCSKQPIKWVSPKMGLLAWDGSSKQLHHLLHYRGLIRVAKAIVQEDMSFRWHLLHKFDTGRAKIIQKELYRKQDQTLLPYFKNQVLHQAKRYQAT